ncbi:nuclear receptor ROR-alpha-like [Babylonia areolata]|uniref:nuclear receptor ROR-alpha-like n=1 Tax=Babylonia areolata TaxID=304850 RepID=UPI003FD0FA9E
MTELQKIVQASNDAYKSDMMRSFVSDFKGQLSQSVAADPGYVGVGTGASLFAPPSTLAAPSTTSSSTGTTTDNANANVLIQESRTDNVQTENGNTTTETNQNTINANRAGTTTISTSTSTSTTASSTTGEEPDTNANTSEVAAMLAEVRGASPETQQLLVQQVSEATVEAHKATCINMQHVVQDARTRFTAVKEAGGLPDMSKMSLSSSAMWEKMTEQIMPEVGKTIQFFKLLPGFNELCLEDQMLLIKQGTFEVMMTRFSMLIDHEKETMLDPSHKMVCPRHVVREMPMGNFLDGFFRVGAQFNPIGLKDDEIGVFTAVMAFSPSRPGLKEAKLIGTIQLLYLRSLFNLMKQNHSDPDTKFTKVLGLVPMFRRMSEEHSKALGAMKMQSPDAFDKQFHPLHKELYTQEQ